MNKDFGLIFTDMAWGVHKCLGVAVRLARIIVALLLALGCCSGHRSIVLAGYPVCQGPLRQSLELSEC